MSDDGYDGFEDAGYNEEPPEDFIDDYEAAVEDQDPGAMNEAAAGMEGANAAVSGVVEGNDTNAAAGGVKAPVAQFREKKVPNDQRSTTPFMTKYERARVLGTRALQIRCVPLLYHRAPFFRSSFAVYYSCLLTAFKV